MEGGALDTNSLGRLGEELAARHLESRGWSILGRNFRHGRGEVDIIATRERVVAFVEVKCRRDLRHGHPLEAITDAKRREIARVARGWLRERELGPGKWVRFDAIAVVYPGVGRPTILHVPDAWRLG
ncbi:MAG: YraN family protein [Gemmatimonadetes bacterium]|nr:YraN family protein [Gemmatimonadota bacterium]